MRSKKAGLGDIGLLCFPLGGFQRVGRPPPLGDIGKRDDDALHPIILGAVGQYPADIPQTVLRLDFPFDRRQRLQHRTSVAQQIAVGGQRVEIGERSTDVGRDDVEERFGRRREETDIEVEVEENGRDIGAIEDVLQIAGGLYAVVLAFLEAGC